MKKLLALAPVLFLLVFAAPVSAQTPTDAQYSDSVTQLEAASDGEVGGTLPFTGFDVGVVGVVGLALFGAGLILRRAARSSV